MQRDGDTDSDTLRALEELLLEASVRKHAAAVSRMLADEFQEFGSSARIYNKAQILAELAAELPCKYIYATLNAPSQPRVLPS